MRLTPIMTRKRAKDQARRGAESAASSSRSSSSSQGQTTISGDASKKRGREDRDANDSIDDDDVEDLPRVKRLQVNPTIGHHQCLSVATATKKKRLPPRRRLTLLDLPTEIMEMIFCLEPNISLPRCDRRIGRLLSSHHTLHWLILDAFSPTWDNWFGKSSVEVMSYWGFGVDGHFGGDSRRQSDILAQGWMTFDRMMDAQDDWFSKLPKPVEHWSLHLFMKSIYTGWLGPVQPGDGSGFTPKAQIQLEWETYLEPMSFAEEAKIFNMPMSAKLAPDLNELMCHPMMDVHPLTRIPDRLITGPWKEGDAMLLFWLLRSDARKSPSQSWELVVEGFERILKGPKQRGYGNERQSLKLEVYRVFLQFGLWYWIPPVTAEFFRSKYPDDYRRDYCRPHELNRAGIWFNFRGRDEEEIRAVLPERSTGGCPCLFLLQHNGELSRSRQRDRVQNGD